MDPYPASYQETLNFANNNKMYYLDSSLSIMVKENAENLVFLC